MLKEKMIKKTSVAIICLIIIALGFLCVSLFTHKAQAEGSFTGGNALESNYYIGQTLDIPEYTFSNGIESVTATPTLYCPDGNATSKKSIFIDKAGEYTLKYNAVVSGNRYTQSFTFYVNDPLYEIKGENGSVAYWGNEGYGEGVIATLKQGDVFHFNKTIDLNKLTASNFIKLFNVPHATYQYDGELIFKLTDIYNEDNAVFIKLYKYPMDESWTYTGAYLSVSLDGNTYYSLRPYGRNKPNNSSWIQRSNDTMYYYWEENAKYGSPVQYSMVGTPRYKDENGKYVIGDSSNLYNNQLDICFDVINQTVYSVCGKRGDCPFVVDFDGEYFTAGGVQMPFFATKWKGFTSNEVKLTIYPSSLKTQSFNLVITEIGGLSGDDLSINVVEDNLAPEILIETDYNLYDMPNSIIGANYHIPTATAKDNATTNVQVKVNVYKNYYSNNRVYCSIENGFVKIASEGQYFIEYKAVDNAGNETVKVISFCALKERETVFSANLSDYRTEIAVGENVELFSDISFVGAVGETAWYIKATHNTSGKEEIIRDKYFRPFYKGEWTVALYYSDAISEQILPLARLNVVGENRAAILESPDFEKYYIQNAQYALPLVEMYILSEDNPKITSYDIQVKEGESDYVAVTKPSAYVVGDCDTVQFRYVYEDEIVLETEKIPVLDVNYTKDKTAVLDVKNYFVGVGANRVATTNGVEVQATQDFSVEFIKKIQVRDLSIQIYLFEKTSSFESFTIELVGEKEEKLQICFTVDKLSGYLYYSVNGRAPKSYERLIDVSEQYEQDITLTLNLLYNKEKGLSIQTDYYEDIDFKGFESDFAYLRFKGEVSQGAFVYSVKSINNQQFNVQSDRVKPQILYYETEKSVEMGGSFYLRGTIIADVLDPFVRTSFCVLTPSGVYAKASDGTILDETADYSKDYVIVPEEYGRYTITYTAKDTLNGLQEIEYTILVYDVERPTIVLEGVIFDGNNQGAVIEQYVQKGESITVKDIEVNDNYSEKIEVYILYKNPNGILQMVNEDKKLTLNQAGVYTVYYIVNDEEGNETTASYVICVEE